jgi:hypothetical protein
MRNSILTHAALYRYQPAEQSYCYVRHYGTGQAIADSQYGLGQSVVMNHKSVCIKYATKKKSICAQTLYKNHHHV